MTKKQLLERYDADCSEAAAELWSRLANHEGEDADAQLIIAAALKDYALMKTPICNCGTATHTPHRTGKDGCERIVVAAPTPAGTHPVLGSPMWDTGDEIVTEYTLRDQRGYHQHEDGTWTRWRGTFNSVEA